MECRITGMLVPLIISIAVTAVSAQSARIEGIAVNGATGEPIIGVEMRLGERPDKNNDKVMGPFIRTSTDRYGRFAFNHLRISNYFLYSDGAGYLKNALVQNGRGKDDFYLRSGETRFFRLVLLPEGSIIGRVLDEVGQPIVGVDVSAIREDSNFGRRFIASYQHWGGSSEASTNNKGEFRIGELDPGRYFIETTFSTVKKVDESLLKKGYVPAYYPDSPTMAMATALCMGAGEQRKIDFHLLPRPMYSVRGKLELPVDFKNNFEVLWGLRREDGGFIGHWTDEIYDHSTNAIVIRPLPPGSYYLEIKTGIYDTDLVASKAFTIKDSDVNNLVLPMHPIFSLRANVHLPEDFHPKESYSTVLNLERDGTDRMIEGGQPITKDGGVSFSHLHQGHYRLYLFTDDAIYIKSSNFGDQDVLANGVSLDGPSPSIFEITLARAKAELKGTVSGDNGALLARADVKLIAQGDDAPYVLKSVNADDDGRFDLTGVPPGKYKLVALGEAVRDWEFGSFEFDQVKQWSKEIKVGDVAITGLELKGTNLRYPASSCSTESQP
jgi:hypothetical protein